MFSVPPVLIQVQSRAQVSVFRMFSPCPRGFFQVLWFPHTSQKKHVSRYISDCKFPLGVNECVNMCVWYAAKNRVPFQGVFPLHSMTRIKCLLKMNELISFSDLCAVPIWDHISRHFSSKHCLLRLYHWLVIFSKVPHITCVASIAFKCDAF